MDTHSFPDQTHLLVREIEHANDYDITVIHRHAYYEIFLFDHVVDGHQIIDLKRHTIKPNSIYIVGPDQIHFLKRNPKENGVMIQFSREFLLATVSNLPNEGLITLNSTPFTEISEAEFQLLTHHFRHLGKLNSGNHQFSQPQVSAYFSYIIFHLLELISDAGKVNQDDRVAHQFMAMVQTHFRERRNVSDYAGKLLVSTNTLSRKVKNSYGKSPLEIIHGHLLLEIKRLLIVNELSHKEICYTLNFDSPGSYNKFVMKQTGLSPTQLQSQLIEMHKS